MTARIPQGFKASCSCCRQRAARATDYCPGCRRVVCAACAALDGLTAHRPHALTDHAGWKAHGGRRPASWGSPKGRASAVNGAPRRPAPGAVVVSSCSLPGGVKILRPALEHLIRARLRADAVGGTL